MISNDWSTDGKYYLNEDGEAVSGKQPIGNKLYYFGEGNVLVKGWFKIGEEIYYATHSDGSLATGTYDWGDNYYVYSKFTNLGAWSEDVLKDKSPSVYDSTMNVRWHATKLVVQNGKRVPMLTVSAEHVPASWEDSISEAIDLYNDSDLGVQLQLVTTESADIIFTTESYNAAYTAVTDVKNESGVITQGFITSAAINFLYLHADGDYTPGKWICAHEIGHALGLRHPYETNVYNPDEDPGIYALMNQYEISNYCCDTLQEYDYQQFEYTYPS